MAELQYINTTDHFETQTPYQFFNKILDSNM